MSVETELEAAKAKREIETEEHKEKVRKELAAAEKKRQEDLANKK